MKLKVYFCGAPDILQLHTPFCVTLNKLWCWFYSALSEYSTVSHNINTSDTREWQRSSHRNAVICWESSPGVRVADDTFRLFMAALLRAVRQPCPHASSGIMYPAGPQTYHPGMAWGSGQRAQGSGSNGHRSLVRRLCCFHLFFFPELTDRSLRSFLWCISKK